jgi:pilus assembly protein CpaB
MAQRQTGGRGKAILLVVIAGLAAVLALSMIGTMLDGYQRELTEAQVPEETIQVMVAAKTLDQGRTIVAADLRPRTFPPSYVPDTVLRTLDQVVGRVPRERILPGEVIREERLADAEAGVGLNAIIPRGMRAMTIDLSGAQAVSGFLNPGNYVDVIITLSAADQQEAETNTILSAVTVLAVNQRLGTGMLQVGGEKGAPQASGITVALTPEQAERLTHAMNQGAVTLSLRNDIDVTQVEAHAEIRLEPMGGEENEVARMSVKEWKQQAVTEQDGTLVIIKGSNSTVQ